MKQITLSLLALLVSHAVARAAPVVFWGSDGVAPGNVALLYGGGLGETKEVRVRSLPDGAPVTVPTIQPCENSVKFVVPASLQPGVIVVDLGGAQPWILNRPELWFLQPTTLRPGLDVNQASPGAEVQVVGKNFAGTKPEHRLAVSHRHW